MKILVGVKRVIDYAVKVRVSPSGSGVDLANVKMSLNPFCEIAVEEAVRLKEAKHASEVVAMTIGPKQATETLRTALAMGCDRGIHVLTDLRPDYLQLQPFAIAHVFQKIIQDPKLTAYDLVLMGKQSIDSDCGQTGPLLAGLLGWPQVTYASKITPNGQGGLEVERETDSGSETLLISSTPAVITCDLRLNEPRYATLPNIMKAKKKTIDTFNLGSLGLEEHVLHSTHEISQVFEPPPRKAGIKVATVDELIDKLRNEAGVIA
jgi:electron transfer flavoprotein beta subunit